MMIDVICSRYNTIAKELVKTVMLLVYLTLHLSTSLNSTSKNTKIARPNVVTGVEPQFIHLCVVRAGFHALIKT